MDPLLAELKEMGVACGELRPVRSKDGVTVVRVTDSQGKRWVLKHFEEPGFRREIQRYRLLGELGVPTLRLMGATAASLLLEDLEESPALRLGVPEDLEDPAVARLLARWYTRLHQAGREYLHRCPDAALYNEAACLTPEALALVQERTGSGGLPIWSRLKSALPAVLSALKALSPTLVYNDFYYTNLAVARDGSSALMYDYNLMGRGYAYGDVRNVCASLGPEAGRAFLEEYGPVDPWERRVDQVVSPLVTLIHACRRESFPAWARPSLEEMESSYPQVFTRFLKDLEERSC